MTVLMYLLTLGWIFVLFASAGTLAVWTIIRTVRFVTRVYRAMKQPEGKPAARPAWENPNQWKRAGQW